MRLWANSIYILFCAVLRYLFVLFVIKGYMLNRRQAPLETQTKNRVALLAARFLFCINRIVLPL